MRVICDSKDRAAWLEARKRLLTASDVPAMLCCAYHKSDAERLQQRAVLRTNKAFGIDGVEETEGMRVARYLESAVIEYARCEMGLAITHNTTLYASDECPMLGATTDAVLIDTDGVECDVDVKCTASAAPENLKVGSQAMFAEGVPMHWQVQVNAQMAVSGRQRGYILAKHHADRYGYQVRLYRIERHEGLIQRIMSDVPVFFAEVEALRAGSET